MSVIVVVARFAEARMIGDHHPVLLGPGQREIEAMERARAVKEDERLALAGGQDDDVDAIDLDLFA